MADKMTPEQRSRCMAAVKGKDTKPEMIVRKYLFSRGLRYRVNVRKLPGTPDIVLRKYKTVVFIDGCFWHGHEGCKHFRLPTSNEYFWRHKIAMNYARDYANNIELELAGWRVVRVWECEVKTKALQAETLRNLYSNITGTSYDNASCHTGTESEAAEPDTLYGK
ncbi:MAG: very short patch repair endonuclease [Muribaculaceae bacterium]|nr:very short patch repair endonuclease [Muribaculaceae bacterium]MDE6532539.1 very short patch repair endonuclease [Muribaculaceae bacterium]